MSSSSSSSSSSAISFLRVFQTTDIANHIYSFVRAREIIRCEAIVTTLIRPHFSPIEKEKRLTRFFRYEPEDTFYEKGALRGSDQSHPRAIHYCLWSSDPDRFRWVSMLHSVPWPDTRLQHYSNILSIKFLRPHEEIVRRTSLSLTHLQEVHLGDHFHAILPPNFFPPSVQRIFVGRHWQNTVFKWGFPGNLREFVICGPYLDDNKHQERSGLLPNAKKVVLCQPFTLRSTARDIRFSEKDFPHGIEVVVFGKEFDWKISAAVFPSSVRQLFWGNVAGSFQEHRDAYLKQRAKVMSSARYG